MSHQASSVKDKPENDGVSMDKTLQREINMARNIQAKLLNGPTPQLSGGELKGSSLPARLIGGDYYDFYPLVNGKIRIVIGDVMGKGIPAAMLMILTRGAFRSASESTKGPGETLTAMNTALCNDLRSLRSFVTLFCADWDPNTKTLTYASAGHSMPLHIKGKEKVIEELPKVSGIMVGGLPNHIYVEESIQLKDNDTVFFYTDGIVEATDTNNEQYKKERLVETLFKNMDEGVAALEQSIMDSLEEFTQGTPQRDDITMVSLRIQEEKSDISSFNSPVINTEE
ncbi:PP2C family protein-serine/threonine phosphatase [Bacillus sp. V33-4]|uniref:PP2C family protein-serine/threonine phosphatase n=1 Tax=Bacillus sp. V33-4 TaxID=2054169 RepID=UPI000C772D98|nr:PP2C family protein-serine/threonine phosphatase [Bacillus sp. V33-4]PLR81393.1 serine/threonine protein phosphatase [Bacillus sp. V33-4]